MLAARPEQAADIADAQAGTRDFAPLEFVEIVIEPLGRTGRREGGPSTTSTSEGRRRILELKRGA